MLFVLHFIYHHFRFTFTLRYVHDTFTLRQGYVFCFYHVLSSIISFRVDFLFSLKCIMEKCGLDFYVIVKIAFFVCFSSSLFFLNIRSMSVKKIKNYFTRV